VSTRAAAARFAATVRFCAYAYAHALYEDGRTGLVTQITIHMGI